MRLDVLTFTSGYQARIGKLSSNLCACCGVVEDVEHVLLGCTRYAAEREEMCSRIQDEQAIILDKNFGDPASICDVSSSRIIGAHPGAVLDFIKKCTFWSDEIGFPWAANRAELRTVDEAGDGNPGCNSGVAPLIGKGGKKGKGKSKGDTTTNSCTGTNNTNTNKKGKSKHRQRHQFANSKKPSPGVSVKSGGYDSRRPPAASGAGSGRWGPKRRAAW